MTRKRKLRKDFLRENIDSLKAFFDVAPCYSYEKIAHPPVSIGAYSRRGTLGSYYIVGAPREQVVYDTMRTYVPATCTKTVADLFFEISSLASAYYDTLDQLKDLDDV